MTRSYLDQIEVEEATRLVKSSRVAKHLEPRCVVVDPIESFCKANHIQLDQGMSVVERGLRPPDGEIFATAVGACFSSNETLLRLVVAQNQATFQP